MTTMRDGALSLAAKGFRVVPLHWPILDTLDGAPLCSCGDGTCTSIGKHPLTKHGVSDASANQATVENWWRQYPNANIGVATGFAFDVIDIDGPEGANAFAVLVAQFGYPQYWASAETGRPGGGHLYTAGGGLSGWQGGRAGFPERLDCKGKGGYVVAPPSLHASGKRYTWTVEPVLGGPVAGHVEWPQWHTAVRESVSGTSGDGLMIRQPSSGSGKFADVVRQRVISEVTAAGEGSRWQTFATVGIWVCAGLIHGGEISEGEAVTLCEELAREIGLSEAEVRRVPAEVTRALGKRTTPIQSRGPSSSTETAQNGTGAIPGAGAPASPAAASTGAVYSEAELLDSLVALKKRDLIVYDRAKRELAQEKLDAKPITSFEDLTTFLAESDEITKYRIEGLWPVGGRTMLAAQFKAGKTTLVGNAVRCLADSARFLGKYQANAPDGQITVLDTEMTRGMFRTWLREQAISNTEKVSFKLLRGKCSSFNITDELTRARWVQHFKETGTEVLILDCLGPVMAALGLNETANEDVGIFIGAFEELVAEADIRESLIVHHMGHSGERSRGASRLRDWPDVEWHLIREGQEDDFTPAPDVPRFFRAYGRDVSEPEQLLHFEPEFRWLTISGEGSRGDVKRSRIAAQIIEIVKDAPGITGRAITDAVRGKTTTVRAELAALITAGTIRVVEGPRRASLHYHCEYNGT